MEKREFIGLGLGSIIATTLGIGSTRDNPQAESKSLTPGNSEKINHSMIAEKDVIDGIINGKYTRKHTPEMFI